MFKMRCGIAKAYILDITMYKMHVSLCSYYTIRILISKTLSGTYEGGYTYVLEMCCYRTLDIVIYIITYSMVQSPSWEANWFAASQEIPRISRNPEVHYRAHKLPPPVSILSQPNPVHILTSHLLEIHPNIIHPYIYIYILLLILKYVYKR